MKNLIVLVLPLIFIFLTKLTAGITAEDNTHFTIERHLINLPWEWNTFMGSINSDDGNGIAVDKNGNVYVTGRSYATWGSPVNAHSGGADAFVGKLNNSGVLQWNTFLGSSSYDNGYNIKVDDTGNIYIAGRSEATWGSPVNAYTGDSDAFAAKLNSSGAILWNTFMGSTDLDYCESIAVDGMGNVYVTGLSEAAWGSPVNAFEGGADAYAVKLNSSGVRVWHTFLGGSLSYDYGWGIAVDGSGNVYIAGYSGETWGSPVNPNAGGFDAFAAKLNSSGMLQWNTFMGSSGWDDGYQIALDNNSNVYVTGLSQGTWGSPVNSHAGMKDAFAAKLNNNGVLQWNTFIGSPYDDEGRSITVDNANNIFITGISSETWGTPVNSFNGGKDAFITKLNSNGVRQGHTFIGSSYSDEGRSVATDGSGYVYAAGSSFSTWGSPINPHAKNGDAFAVKLEYSNITKIETDLDLPEEFQLLQNYPNPFNAFTLIKYSLPYTNHVTLKVYSILGEEITTLVNQFQTQDHYTITFNAARLPGGIYLYKLNIGKKFVKIKKMILIK
jgi:hypothetical protein